MGDNLIADITDDTVQFMGNWRNNGIWNLRYLNKNSVVLSDIPENYFCIPVLVTDLSQGSVTQFVTVKSGTSYALSCHFKSENGTDCVPYIEGFSDSGSLGQLSYGYITTDTDGYYNYQCEFKTPANLRDTDNLRVGFLLDGIVGAYTELQLLELDAGFEKIGSNLLRNGTFANAKKLAIYDGTPRNIWMFEGDSKNAEYSTRLNTYFKIPVPQVYLFAGGSAGNYIGRTVALTPGETYQLSFNLKYANPGYEGDTGVELSYRTAADWVDLPALSSESETEFAYTYSFTLPADAVSGQNMRFRVKVGSYYVSGSIANATLFDVKDMNTNLIENGDFSNGSTGWERASGFRQTYLYQLPDDYFRRDKVKDSMIYYRNSGTWDHIMQDYLALKSDTYYLLVAEAVQVWPEESEIDSGNELGAVHSILVYQRPYEGANRSQQYLTATQTTKLNNKTIRLYKTPSDMEEGGNTYFRMVMQDVGDAGYWGSFALYESDENGNIVSNNILLNSDFSLGKTAWSFS